MVGYFRDGFTVGVWGGGCTPPSALARGGVHPPQPWLGGVGGGVPFFLIKKKKLQIITVILIILLIHNMMMNEVNNKYNCCIINTTLVQAVLDRQNSEAANSRKRSTEKFLSQCTPPTRSCWINRHHLSSLRAGSLWESLGAYFNTFYSLLISLQETN